MPGERPRGQSRRGQRGRQASAHGNYTGTGNVPAGEREEEGTHKQASGESRLGLGWACWMEQASWGSRGKWTLERERMPCIPKAMGLDPSWLGAGASVEEDGFCSETTAQPGCQIPEDTALLLFSPAQPCRLHSIKRTTAGNVGGSLKDVLEVSGKLRWACWRVASYLLGKEQEGGPWPDVVQQVSGIGTSKSA